MDFFCGLGNFTLPLARRARRVIGIEGHAGLVQRATAAAHQNGLAEVAAFETANLVGFQSDDWMRLVGMLGRVDRVLVDPPREGALELVRTLAGSTVAPGRLVYVSCNPATLARDCAVLVQEGGWRCVLRGWSTCFRTLPMSNRSRFSNQGPIRLSKRAAAARPMLDWRAKLRSQSLHFSALFGSDGMLGGAFRHFA